MTVVVDDDFGTDTSANYAGVALTISGGNATQAEDGISRHTTATTGNELWVRWYPTGTAWQSNGGIAISDASGNGFIVIFNVSGSNIVIDWLTEYDTYTTYAGNDDDIANPSLGTPLAGPVGVTIDIANNVMRFWNPVTADEPTSLTSWDGNAAEQTVNYGTLGQTQDGNYIGLGNWNTGGSTLMATRFAFGTIGGAAATALMPRKLVILQALSRAANF